MFAAKMLTGKVPRTALVIVGNTGVPCFSKVHFTPLHFYQRPTLVPVFDNQRNPKRNFAFTNEANRFFALCHFNLQKAPRTPFIVDPPPPRPQVCF